MDIGALAQYMTVQNNVPPRAVRLNGENISQLTLLNNGICFAQPWVYIETLSGYERGREGGHAVFAHPRMNKPKVHAGAPFIALR